MKKRKFYNDKKRNEKWTEEPQGHRIDFAEKYIGEGHYSDKYDYKRPAHLLEQEKKEKKRKVKKLKIALSVFLCVMLVCVGYTSMTAFTLRHEKPLSHIGSDKVENEINLADLSIEISASKVESVSLDSSVMLSSVTSELTSNGFTALVFDAKRDDGTIGYASTLASIDTFSAISNASSHPKASIKQLIKNDILPIARICVYKDNVVPNKDSTASLKRNGKLYKDGEENTYLNPNSDSAYSYIKDIITELNGYGVTVFILYGCDLPEDISGKYNDGFNAISERLEKDFDYSIKLLEEVDVAISGKDSESGRVTSSALKKEISEIKKPNDNQILYISTKADSRRVRNQLIRNNLNCYVIND